MNENMDPKITMGSDTVLIKVGGQDRKVDGKIAHVQDDPRVNESLWHQKALSRSGKGHNTESFDPKSTLVRPDARVIIGKLVASFLIRSNTLSLRHEHTQQAQIVRYLGKRSNMTILSWFQSSSARRMIGAFTISSLKNCGNSKNRV